MSSVGSASSTTSSSAPQSPITSSSAPTPTPTYVERVRWVRDARGRSLRVVPSRAGRATKVAGAAEVAWRQVLRLAPAADTPTMKAQFDCHWTFARLAEPAKPSWNLETWRPVVSAQTMFDTRCNPGGQQE